MQAMATVFRFRYLYSAILAFICGSYFLITGLIGYLRVKEFRTGGAVTTATVTRDIRIPDFPARRATGNPFYYFDTYSYYVNHKLFTGHSMMGYDLGTQLNITYLKAKPWISGETYAVTSPFLNKFKMGAGAFFIFLSGLSIVLHLFFPTRRFRYRPGAWNSPF